MRGVLLYDGECGLCLCSRRAIEPLDIFHSIEWLPYQHPDARRFGIPYEEMEQSIQFVAGPKRWSGFAAVKQVLLRLPLLYAAAGLAAARRPKLVIPAVALFFSPPFQPAGQALYHFVSEHRHEVPRNLCGCAPPVAAQARGI